MYGEEIKFFGKLKVKLLNRNHQILTLSFPKIESVKNSENYFLAIVSSTRQKIIVSFQEILPKDSVSPTAKRSILIREELILSKRLYCFLS
jgi:hypothetical protein